MKKVNSISDVIDFMSSSDSNEIYNLLDSYSANRSTPDKDVFMCISSIPELTHIHKKLKNEGFVFTSVIDPVNIKTSNQKMIRSFLIDNLPKLLEEIKEEPVQKGNKKKKK